MHPTPEPNRAGLYLHGLLAGGVRPFAYRRGVYALLGMPEADGQARFGAPLPPVGFVYAAYGPDEPRPSAEPPEVPPPYRPGRAEARPTVPSPAPVAPVAPPVQSVPPEARIEASLPVPAGIATPEGSATTPPPSPAPLVPRTSAPARPELVLPGRTDRVQVAPEPVALSEVDPRVGAPFAAAALSPAEDPPVVPLPSAIPPLRRVLKPTPPAPRQRTAERPAGLDPLPEFAFSEPAASVAGEPQPALPAPAPALRGMPDSVPPASMQVRPDPVHPRPAEPIAPRPASGVPARVRPERPYRRVRSGAVPVDAPEAPGAAPNLAPPRPAPPVQPVVVVRPTPAPKRRAAYAFWKQSTVRSTHLRLLR